MRLCWSHIPHCWKSHALAHIIKKNKHLLVTIAFERSDYPPHPHEPTVNSENFARVYFRETSHMRSFEKTKSSRNSEITLSFSDALVAIF